VIIFRNYSEFENSILMSKYWKLEELFHKMTELEIEKRTKSCEEILQNKELWALSLQELKDSASFESVLNLKKSKSFVYKLFNQIISIAQDLETNEINSQQKFDDILIRVTNEEFERVKGESYYHFLIKKPRGKCIVINDELKLLKESKRIESIFTQLFFEVDLIFNKTAEEIISYLKILSENESVAEDEALIVMIISHGMDEKIFGVKYKEDTEDSIQISRIVDIFLDKNSSHLWKKPKIFFFNCVQESESFECKL
jgi:hypothetical protein